MYKLITCFISLIVILSLQSCSAIISATTPGPLKDEPEERTSGSILDDEIIETKILVNLDKADPELAQSHISVTSYNAVVLLTGQVSSQRLKDLATETAQGFSKVRRVHNELTIAGAISMIARSNDTWITSKVKSKLLANSKIQGGQIKVVTENGVVFLMGLVNKDEAQRATEVTRKTAGVQKVVRIFEHI